MKVIKLTAIAGAALALSTLTSCLKSDDAKDERTINFKVLSLVTPKDVDKPSNVATGTYAVTLDNINGTMSVSTANLKLETADLDFTTDYTKFTLKTNGQNLLVYNANWPLTESTSGYGNVENLNLLVSNGTYFVGDVDVPGYPLVNVDAACVIGYKVNNFEVHTFPQQAFYVGKTSTTYPNQDGTQGRYENEGIVYRVVLNVVEKKALVILYHAKFAEKAPELAMVLKDLDITYNHGGYKVSGTNVIPEVVGDGGLTPYPNFKFDKFEMSTIDMQLTQVRMNYDVASRYHGEFRGTYFGQ